MAFGKPQQLLQARQQMVDYVRSIRSFPHAARMLPCRAILCCAIGLLHAMSQWLTVSDTAMSPMPNRTLYKTVQVV